MKTKALIVALAVGASVTTAVVSTATAQGMRGNMVPGTMPGDTDQRPADHRTVQDGAGMMCPMMGSSRTEGGMMQGGTMQGGMMQGGMMQGGMMQGGMMGSGMMGTGMTALFGSRVTPVMNLSVDDVRGYLASQLERLNNKRFKVGDINSGDATITADIVTVDNSLVQRLKIDRHSGAITYEN
jgi:hypothetical protein